MTTFYSLLLASTFALGGQPQCTMKPPTIETKAIKASKDVRSFVIDDSRSASIFLINGDFIRVVGMGCVDSGSVARLWITSPPPDSDVAAWRALFVKTAKIAFGAYAGSFESWVPKASFTSSDRFVLTASISGDVDMRIDVQRMGEGMGDMVTMSFTYH